MANKNDGGNNEDKHEKNKMQDAASSEAQSISREEEEALKQLQDEVDKLATKDIVIQMMMSISSIAYKKMGLPVGTNDKFKDKSQAKLAVDCFDALLKVVGDEVAASELENLKSSLSNLQLNFVKIFS